MQTQELNIYYEGNQYKDGKIDIKEFAPSLLAFGEIIDEVNQAINDKKKDVKTYIKADFENKCFKCTVSLEAHSILDKAKDVFGIHKSATLDDLINLVGFVNPSAVVVTGVIASFFVYKRWQRGRKIKNSTFLDNGNVRLELEGEEITREVTFNLFKFIKFTHKKTSKFTANFKKHTEVQGQTGYSKPMQKMQLMDADVKESIFKPDLNLENMTEQQDPILTNLVINRPDYYGEKNCEFVYAGKTIKPILADHVKEQFKGLKKEVVINCKLPVEMIIEYDINEDKEAIPNTEKYYITKITGALICGSKEQTLL